MNAETTSAPAGTGATQDHSAANALSNVYHKTLGESGKFPVALYQHSRDNSPTSATATWGDLSQILTAATNGDKDGAAWSPVSIRPGGRRRSADVNSVHALVIDVDGPLSDAERDLVVDRVKGRQLDAIIHSTHSSRPGAWKLRVIVPLDRPVRGEQWSTFYRSAVALLDLPGVNAVTHDPSRLFYLPRVPEGVAPWSAVVDGKPLRVDAVPIIAAPEPVRLPVDIPTRPEIEVVSLPTTAENAAATILARHWPKLGNGRHYASLELAGALAHHGWSADRISAFITAIVAALPDGGDGEPAKRQGQAADSVAKVAAGESVSGFPSLATRIVGARIARACEWLGIDWTPTPVDLSTRMPRNESEQSLHVRIGEVAKRERPPIRTYSTGIAQLDRLLGGGLSTRQLAVLGAPPADGKSALAVSISLHVQSTIPVLYASTELESDELEARLASPLLDKPWRDIVRGKVERQLVADALSELAIYVIGCDVLPRGTDAIDALRASAKQIAVEHGEPPLVILDYMQDLARGADDRSLRARVGEIATQLRVLSQDLDCALLAVCSVSRAYYGKSKADALRNCVDASAYLAAMKESGDVDYAAAVVLFLDVAEPENGSRMARIAVAKSRHGETGFAGAKFYGAPGNGRATRWQRSR